MSINKALLKSSIGMCHTCPPSIMHLKVLADSALMLLRSQESGLRKTLVPRWAA